MGATSGGAIHSFGDVESFLGNLDAAPSGRRARVAARAPVGRIQLAALEHPDPFVRRRSLEFLDHHASDESGLVFAAALADPVEPVRRVALHSIACERCRVGQLCASDVVPRLIHVLANDPSPEMRHRAIPALLALGDGDGGGGARAAVERAARDDADEVVRDVAARALRGEHVRARKAYVRGRRRS